MDVTIVTDNGNFTKDLFVKPTDEHQYLDFRSYHPRGCKRSISYAQALRLQWICSSDEHKMFFTRGYKGKFVKQQVQRAKRLSREELLTPATESTKRNSTRTPFIVTYHPGLPNIGGILRDLHPILQLSEKCGKAIREIPVLAFRKPKSLKDYLVRAKVQKQMINAEGNRSRGSSVCQICRDDSNGTGKTYDIQCDLDCNSSNVVYLTSCKSCGKQYVRSTTTKFRLRLNNHKSRMRRHSRLAPEDRDVDDLIYRHFRSKGHCGLDDMSIQLIEKVTNASDLLGKEGQWAYRLQAIRLWVLNENDFFYSQYRRKGRIG